MVNGKQHRCLGQSTNCRQLLKTKVQRTSKIHWQSIENGRLRLILSKPSGMFISKMEFLGALLDFKIHCRWDDKITLHYQKTERNTQIICYLINLAWAATVRNQMQRNCMYAHTDTRTWMCTHAYLWSIKHIISSIFLSWCYQRCSITARTFEKEKQCKERYANIKMMQHDSTSALNTS